MQTHKELANAVRDAVQKQLGDTARLFERHAGLLYTRTGVPVTAVKTGMADLYGWVKTRKGARHVEIELKIYPDKLSDAQEKWRNVCEATGVAYRLSACKKTGVAEEAQATAAWLLGVRDGD
jgi:hypothetical protein